MNKPAILSLLVAALALACARTSPDDLSFSADDDAGTSSADASSGRDAGRDAGPDAGQCSAADPWRLERRTVVRAALLGPGAPVVGTTQRLELGVQLDSGCERLARVEVNVQPGNATDFVTVGAQAWVPQVPCGGPGGVVNAIVALPGVGSGNLRVVVETQSMMGKRLLTYDRQICGARLSCLCAPGTPRGATPVGAACDTDCNCKPGLSCVAAPSSAFPGYAFTCQEICSDSRDCSVGQHCAKQEAALPPFVCAPACGSNDQCAPLACEGGQCVDHRGTAVGSPCRCDGECAAGLLCADLLDGRKCQIPCESTEQCPSPGGVQVFVCGTDPVCRPLD